MISKVEQKQILIVGFISVSILMILWNLYHSVVVPMGISFFLSFVLLPLVDRYHRRGIPRPAVVSAILGLTLVVVSFCFVRFIPTVYDETLELIKLAPSVYARITSVWIPHLRLWAADFKLMDPEQFDLMLQGVQRLSVITDRLPQAAATLWNSAPVLINIGISLFLVPLLTFFILKDYPTYSQYFRGLIHPRLRRSTEVILVRLSRTLRDVISGQVLVASILGSLYIVGLNIVGINAATVIGLVAGVCRIVPYLDIVVGVFLSLMVILSDFHGPHQIIGVALVFTIVQSLDGMLITPRVIGERAGIHPVIVIVSIIAFGESFGFLGVILAIPVIALARQLWLVVQEAYFNYGN